MAVSDTPTHDGWLLRADNTWGAAQVVVGTKGLAVRSDTPGVGSLAIVYGSIGSIDEFDSPTPGLRHIQVGADQTTYDLLVPGALVDSFLAATSVARAASTAPTPPPPPAPTAEPVSLLGTSTPSSPTPPSVVDEPVGPPAASDAGSSGTLLASRITTDPIANLGLAGIGLMLILSFLVDWFNRNITWVSKSEYLPSFWWRSIVTVPVIGNISIGEVVVGALVGVTAFLVVSRSAGWRVCAIATAVATAAIVVLADVDGNFYRSLPARVVGIALPLVAALMVFVGAIRAMRTRPASTPIG